MDKAREHASLDSFEIKTLYKQRQRDRTLKIGRLSAYIGIPGIILFSLQDIYILGFHDLIGWRMLGIAPLLIFLILSFTAFEKRPGLIIPLHILSLT